MNIKEILSRCDHTILSQTATWEEVKAVLDDAMCYQTASACIPPSYVKKAKEYVADRLAICTVIGFPNGYHTTAVKCYETKDALQNGADEIDMVINVGWLKDMEYDRIRDEIAKIKEICADKILKVIIETCLLNDDEKKIMCDLVVQAGADYIKTSTGFSKAGATLSDVKLMVEGVAGKAKVKAAGGISDLEDAKAFLDLGADRLGTSRVVKAVKTLEKGEM